MTDMQRDSLGRDDAPQTVVPFVMLLVVGLAGTAVGLHALLSFLV